MPINPLLAMGVQGLDTASPVNRLVALQQQKRQNDILDRRSAIEEKRYEAETEEKKAKALRDRQESVLVGAATLSNLLDKNDIAGAEAFLTTRQKALVESGKDPSDTVEAIELLHTNPEKLKAIARAGKAEALSRGLVKEDGFTLGATRYDHLGNVIVSNEKTEPPTRFERKVGDRIVTEEFNPQTGQYEAISDAPRFNPTPQTVVNNTSMAPVQGVDAQGNSVFFQPSKSGEEPVILETVKPKPKEATFSPKELQTARGKVESANRLREQIRNARQRFAAIKDSFSAGPGSQVAYTEAGKQFDAAIDDLRSTVTSLTRTPGVGAMSDYETRLDQSKLPSRSEYEAVIQQKLDQLDALANGVASGYGDILAETEQGGPKKRIRYDAQGNRLD